MPAIFTNYLPSSFVQVPTLLFGVAAVLVARNPEGIIPMNARQLSGLGRSLAAKSKRREVHGRVDGQPRIPIKGGANT
jgi:branched-chain amino acid transport system permease protein